MAAFGIPDPAKPLPLRSGSFTFNGPQPGFNVQHGAMPQQGVPGATATGSQIDRPTGVGPTGYGQAPTPPSAFQQTQDWLQKFITGQVAPHQDVLNNQLRSSYASGTFDPIRSWLVQYGAVPGGLDASRFAAPTDLNGKPLGDSLATLGSDPNLVGAATGNPFSTVHMISEALRNNNIVSAASILGRGFSSSGEFGNARAQNQEGADQASYTARQELFGKIADAIQASQNARSTAEGQLQGYTNDASTLANTLINSGLFGVPASPTVAPPYTPAKTKTSGAAPYTKPLSTFFPNPGARAL